MSETGSTGGFNRGVSLEKLSKAETEEGTNGAPAVAIVLALLVAAAAGLFVFRFQGDVPEWLLGVGAFVGACGLFAILGWIAGLIHFGKPSRQISFLEETLNAVEDCVVVTDMGGRVAFANSKYRAFCGIDRNTQASSVENLYAGYPDFSGLIYRLSQAGKSGKSAREELRLEPDSAAPGADGDSAKWLGISVEPVSSGTKQTHILWRIADESEAKRAQEDAFAKLQDIINYLDTAPAGFFSADADGTIHYMNATLADWLGRYLADVLDGGMKIADLVADDGAKL